MAKLELAARGFGLAGASLAAPDTAGFRHFGRRRLLSMAQIGSPLPYGHGTPNLLMTAALGCGGFACLFRPRRGGHSKRKRLLHVEPTETHFRRSQSIHRLRNLVPARLNRNVLFTDGAKYLADQAGAYWLLDEIALIQPYDSRVAAEEFQVWKLAVNTDRTATLTCDDGNGTIVFTKQIEYTDFPLDEVRLYFANNVIHLPSEY